MKPTPGPWELEDDSQQIDGIGRVKMCRVVAPNGDVVVEFSNTGCSEIGYEDDPDYGGEHYDHQAIANAELIARAPDLLAENEKLKAALRAVLETSPRDTPFSWCQIKLAKCNKIAADALGVVPVLVE